jgi:hypothetical protein
MGASSGGSSVSNSAGARASRGFGARSDSGSTGRGGAAKPASRDGGARPPRPVKGAPQSKG